MSSSATQIKPSTARKGNPREASRGAMVERAKNELAALIDNRLSLDVGHIRLQFLAFLTGVKPSEARDLIDCATLNDFERWSEKVVTSRIKLKPDGLVYTSEGSK